MTAEGDKITVRKWLFIPSILLFPFMLMSLSYKRLYGPIFRIDLQNFEEVSQVLGTTPYIIVEGWPYYFASIKSWDGSVHIFLAEFTINYLVLMIAGFLFYKLILATVKNHKVMKRIFLLQIFVSLVTGGLFLTLCLSESGKVTIEPTISPNNFDRIGYKRQKMIASTIDLPFKLPRQEDAAELLLRSIDYKNSLANYRSVITELQTRFKKESRDLEKNFDRNTPGKNK